jgi:hypothetical protein
MSRQLFVWRLARGPRAGAPCENTPGQGEASQVPRERRHLAQGPINDTGALDDVFEELSHGRLRCGWGAAHPAVEGWLDAPSGGEHERIACQHDGASDPETSPAMGSRTVLCCLLEMSTGDVVFLPKSPDDRHFIVATVTHPNAGDHEIGVAETDPRHDGRHVIGVDETMRYAYGAGTLYPDLLEAPRRQAIQRLSEDDTSYHTLEEFLRSWGR